mmetsp:Transcript_12759/g.35670  ORF Transcript_12759/g.35670 Transcript_12759/m.35670 type:complete len:100 (-) Transcript_12759:129-428(-)
MPKPKSKSKSKSKHRLVLFFHGVACCDFFRACCFVLTKEMGMAREARGFFLFQTKKTLKPNHRHGVLASVMLTTTTTTITIIIIMSCFVLFLRHWVSFH